MPFLFAVSLCRLTIFTDKKNRAMNSSTALDFALPTMGEGEWKATIVRVGERLFFTSVETLTQYPGSMLAVLFSPPYPLLQEDDPVSRKESVHVLPQTLAQPDTFGIVMDFLRCGEWMPMRSESQYDSVCATCKVLGIPSLPAPPASQKMLLRSLNMKESRVEHQTYNVRWPTESLRRHQSFRDSPVAMSLQDMWALGRRGYKVSAECANADLNGVTRVTFSRRVPLFHAIRTIATEAYGRGGAGAPWLTLLEQIG